MSLRLVDGFDRYADNTNSALNKFWSPSFANSNIVPRSTLGKFGEGCVKMTAFGAIQSQTFTSVLDMRMGTRVAFWMKVDGLPPTNSLNSFVTFTSSGTSEKGYIQLRTDGSLLIRVWTGATGGGAIALTDPVIVAGGWQHVEVNMIFSGTLSSNSVQIWVDDVLKFSGNLALALLTTNEAGMSTVDSVTLGDPGGTDPIYFDDFILWQFSPDNPFFLANSNTPLGSHRIFTYSPIGNGQQVSGVPVGAADAWSAVKDPLENDGDTSYITDTGLSQFRVATIIYRPLARITNTVAKRVNPSTTKMKLLMADPYGTQFSEEFTITGGYVRYQGRFPRMATSAVWDLSPAENGVYSTQDSVQSTQEFMEVLVAANNAPALVAEAAPADLGFVPKVIFDV